MVCCFVFAALLPRSLPYPFGLSAKFLIQFIGRIVSSFFSIAGITIENYNCSLAFLWNCLALKMLVGNVVALLCVLWVCVWGFTRFVLFQIFECYTVLCFHDSNIHQTCYIMCMCVCVLARIVYTMGFFPSVVDFRLMICVHKFYFHMESVWFLLLLQLFDSLKPQRHTHAHKIRNNRN